MESQNKDVIIDSWEQLQKVLFEDSYNAEKQWGRYRSPYAYRGLSDKSYELKTSLVRLGGNYHELESHILRNFKKYTSRQIKEGTVWELLAVAQHHGLPTRLLDWTFSPYVALHFATEDTLKFDKDGIVWCIDIHKINEKLPLQFKGILDKEGAYLFTVDILREIGSLAEFDKYRDLHNRDFSLFFEPPSLTDRIINQYGCFSIMSNNRGILNQFIKGEPKLYKKIIIPSNLKWEIRDKLDQANINERILFPGLEGISKWLKRYYSPKS